jgi:hypothetical protein
MPGLRTWHIMAAVVAFAVLFGAARLDEGPTSCTPVAPLLLLSYVFGLLGLWAARWRGRRPRTGLFLGLLLGPLGVLIACSRPVPEGGPERRVS